MDFEFLFRPVEQLDESLTHLFEGAPLLVALGIAFVLGLRHASDPDHLVAVTSWSPRTTPTIATPPGSAPGGASATRRCCWRSGCR